MTDTPATAIDVTPTWEEIVPALILLLEHGTEDGRKTAEQELRKMAKLADLGAETARWQKETKQTFRWLGADFRV